VLDAVKAGGVVTTVRAYTGDGRPGVRVAPANVVDMTDVRTPLERLRRLAEDGAVTLRVARTYPAEQAAEAHRVLEGGGVRSRLVLTF